MINVHLPSQDFLSTWWQLLPLPRGHGTQPLEWSGKYRLPTAILCGPQDFTITTSAHCPHHSFMEMKGYSYLMAEPLIKEVSRQKFTLDSAVGSPKLSRELIENNEARALENDVGQRD